MDRNVLSASIQTPSNFSTYNSQPIYHTNKTPIPPTTGKDRKHSKEFELWWGMRQRCDDERGKSKPRKYKAQSYIGVKICEDWLRGFEAFGEWLVGQENYKKWKQGSFCLDKDICKPGNKLYSPETCFLIPQRFNDLFKDQKSNRGEYPRFVYKKENGKYKGQVSDSSYHIVSDLNRVSKSFDTPEEAFLWAKDIKTRIIREAAEKEYREGNITRKCYEAALRYEIYE